METDKKTDLAPAFREAFRHHPAGVAVITADPGEGPVAITVSSLISVSADPPTVAFSLSAKSSATTAILRAETMVIHFLRLADLPLAQLGATSGADRFGPGINWVRLPTGEPRYAEVTTWFRARVTGTLPLKGATLVAAELLDGHAEASEGGPEALSMVYVDRRWHGLRTLLEDRL
ncbi:MAG: flavin reductase family protein [Paracoccaceae bacterium]